ncbi:hypothetical protein IWW34DRAFT_612268 [Fusarium oxysporum f. sp. albedinis]|nr:hypothetical protein IWW34DRAFT_612268 [Fusarium oxysporum f. sp. albedinis]KAJ0138795.1 Protein msp1 [Fusarium oxysporum f. sp. albedinis]KAK2478441.1 hypothetical protein H9L39_10929 [Fusarium oxysporum f. sp. albedinis]
MAYYRPSRQQARPYGYDDDYVAPDPGRSYDPYDDRNAPPPRKVRREPATDASPPRRYKTQRSRRPPSPGRPGYPDDPMMDDRRAEGRPRRRYEPERRGRSAGPDRRSRDISPPPFGPPPDSPRRKARSARPDRDAHSPEREFRQSSREPRSGRDRDRERELPIRGKRDARPDRYPRFERDAPPVHPYDRNAYAREPTSRAYPDDPRDQRRSKHRDAEPESPRRHGRSVPPSPRSKSQGRGRKSRYPDSDSDSEDDHYGAKLGAAGAGPGAAAAASRRRPRSQTRDRRGRDPARSPNRGRPPTTQKNRGSGPAGRRSSMPASTKPRTAWWQNPMVQAGARTAFTAGAQAAMKSGHESGPWLGPKGAKVATAALGAALVDGFMGQKHPNSTRQKLMRQGVDLASAQTTRVPEHHGHSRRR